MVREFPLGNEGKNIIVTVYVTTQNRPELLDRALHSLHEQTFSDFEVIVCDDCSNHENHLKNMKVIEKHKGILSSLKYLRNDQVKGACYSRNLAISHAKGEYITGLDDDDLFHHKRLELFLQEVKKGSYSFLCANSKKYTGTINEPLKSGCNEITFEEMKKYNAVGNQIFVRTALIKSVGGFDEKMPAWQDYDTWFRLIYKYGTALKIKACTMYLDDNDNRIRITTSSKAYKGYCKFIAKHESFLNKSELASLYYLDKINRKENFNVFKACLRLDMHSFIKVFKYSLTYKYPAAYRIYEKTFK
ncbi:MULTISPECIES: glycosyltransferase [unclassified Tatumella]|uniref:glycosyltransferase n=1 Tax=unclassified Tatumella TaxID=2649542 RepID=UPI001BAE5C77|nr:MULTISPECIES: glycosyltransferase [unclassified Tatumella]MBS0876914.1 glycosyltransferase [Tatumella sp. JGM82]MBS0891944.1 glycosyltransferase [Tatumella sp. JGM94]MBS0900546.1 glycosyltransferase [Tatumella sp. JGM100]